MKTKKYQLRNNEIYGRRKNLDSIKELYKRNPSKAKSELLHHLDEHPNDPYATYYYGQICEKEGDFESAEAAYKKVAVIGNRNRFAGVYSLGEIARKRNNIPLAKKYYLEAITESPTEQTVAIYALARIEKGEGNYEEALRILSLSQRPASELEIEKVKVLISADRIKEAMTLLDSIVPTSEEQRCEIYLIKAKNAVVEAEIPAAKYYFLKAKEITRKNYLYYKIVFEEARMLYEIGEYQAAIDNCEEIYRTGERFYGNVNYIIGKANEALGNYHSALINYKMASKEVGVSDEFLALTYFSLGILEYVMGDFEQAEKDLKTNMEINKKINGIPVNSAVLTLISIYIKQKRYKEASKLISEARTYTVDSGDIDQLDLAEVLIAKKTNASVKIAKRTYRTKQILNYSKEDAIKHIKSHHQGNDPDASQFARSIDIEELYESIKSQMTDENIVYIDLMDKYVIDCQEIGYAPDGTILNRIGVVAIPGTKDIITMYPDTENAAIRKSDILKKMPSQRSKASDRISKFNSKYNLNK